MDEDSTSVFLTPSRLDALRERIHKRTEPQYSAWKPLLEFAENQVGRSAQVQTSWRVPWYYVEPEEHGRLKNVLRDDANAAYAQAIAYRMTGDARFATSAIALLDSWVQDLGPMSTEEDSTLAFSNLFPAFVFAADLLRSSEMWAKPKQARFEDFLRARALPMNCMERDNNWGNWGLVLVVACGAYLKDARLLEQCVSRWKFFIDTQIAEDGHLPHEVNRSEGRHGIWYTHFSLMPQTIAGEILRQQGFNVFHHVSAEGRTLQDACERLIPWIEKPETFPYWKGAPEQLVRIDYYSYFEILRGLWPALPVDNLLREARPMSAEHSAPFLTFTHGVNLNDP